MTRLVPPSAAVLVALALAAAAQEPGLPRVPPPPGVGGPPAPADAALRRDYFEVAERLSMDVRFELAEVDAVLLLKKLRDYGALGAAAKSADPELAKLAADTARAYANLESLHFIYHPAPGDTDEAILALFTRLLANGRLRADTDRLRRFQHGAWPRALPLAARCAGPDRAGEPALKFEAAPRPRPGRTRPGPDLEFTNRTGRRLTNCTLAVTVEDTWGKAATLAYFLREWGDGETFCRADLVDSGPARKVGYQLFADQLRDARADLDSDAVRATARAADAAAATFAAGKSYTGTWTNAKQKINGRARLRVTAVEKSPIDQMFVGPRLRATLTDLGSGTVFTASGSYSTPALPSGAFSFIALLRGQADDPNIRPRTFQLRAAPGGVAGRDDADNTFDLRAD